MATMVLLPPEANAIEPSSERRPRRHWGDKFRDALRGMRRGIRGHSSFFVHFFTAALVVLAGLAFQCNLFEWCLLLLCIGSVFVAELFNSAIETLVRGLDPAARDRSKCCLDIAAGAVLMASLFAATIGTLILGARVLNVLGW
jgi:diacylglycerol kinase